MADDPLSLLDSLTAPLKAVGEGVSTALGSILDATEKQRQRSAETAATIQGAVEQANSPLANVLQINQHLTDAAPDAAEYQKRVSHAQERGLRVPHSSAALKGMLPTNIAPKHWAPLGEYAYDPDAFGLQQSQDGARWMQPRNEPLPKPEIVDVSPRQTPTTPVGMGTRGFMLDAQEPLADLFDTVERKLNERQSATPHESTVEGGAPDWSAMSPKLAQAGFVPIHAVPPTQDPAATAQFMVESHRPGLGQTTPEAARAEAAGTDDLPLWAMPGVKLLTVGGNLGKAAGEAYRQFVDNPFDVATPDVKAQRAVDEKAYAQQLSEYAKHAKGQYETLAALSRDPTQAADYRAMAKNIDRWIPVAVRAHRDPTFLKPEHRETLAEFGFPGYSAEHKATDQGFGIAPKSETTIKNPHLRAAAEWAGIQDYYKPRKEGESWSVVPTFSNAMRSLRDVFAGNFMMALHVLDTLGGDPNMSAEQAWEKTKDLTSGFAGGMAGMFAPVLGAAALDKDSLSAIQRQIQHDPFGWTVAANAAAGAARGWSRRAVEGFVEGSGKLRVLGPELAKMQDRIFDDSMRRTVHGQGRDYVGDFAQAAGKAAARLTPDAIENYLADKVLPKVVDAAGKVGDAMGLVPVTATGAASLAGLILDKLTQKKGLGFYRMLIHAPWHAVDEASKEVQAEYRNAMGTDDIRLAEMGEALPRGSVKAKEKLYREMHSAAPGTMIDQTGYDALLYMSKSADQATAEAAKSLLSEADKTRGRTVGIVELPTYELDKPNAQYRLRPEVDAVAKWAMAERNNPAHPAYERQAMGQIVSAANDALGMVGYLNQHQGVQKALEFSRDVTERMAAQGDKPKFGVEQADFNAAQLGVDVAEQHVNQLTQVLGSPKEVERVVRETQRSVDRVADALKRAKGDARQAAALRRQIGQELQLLGSLHGSVSKDAARSAAIEAFVEPIRRQFEATRKRADDLYLSAQRRGQTIQERQQNVSFLEQSLPSDRDVASLGAAERQRAIGEGYWRKITPREKKADPDIQAKISAATAARQRQQAEYEAARNAFEHDLSIHRSQVEAARVGKEVADGAAAAGYDFLSYARAAKKLRQDRDALQAKGRLTESDRKLADGMIERADAAAYYLAKQTINSTPGVDYAAEAVKLRGMRDKQNASGSSRSSVRILNERISRADALADAQKMMSSEVVAPKEPAQPVLIPIPSGVQPGKKWGEFDAPLPTHDEAKAMASLVGPFSRAMDRMIRQQARGRVKDQIADWLLRPAQVEAMRARGATAAKVANQLRRMAARDEKNGELNKDAVKFVNKMLRVAEAAAAKAHHGDVYRREAIRLTEQAHEQQAKQHGMTAGDVTAMRRAVADERRLLTQDQTRMANAVEAGKAAERLGGLLDAAETKASDVQAGAYDPSKVKRKPFAVRTVGKIAHLGGGLFGKFGHVTQKLHGLSADVATIEQQRAQIKGILDLVQQHAKELDKGISAKDKAVALLDDLRAVRSAVKPDALRQSTAIAEHYEPTWDQIKQLNADRITEMNARKDPAKPGPNEIATEFLEAHPQWLEGGTKLRTNNAAGVHGAATPSWLTNSFNKRKVPYSERVRRFGLVESTDVVRNRMLQDAVSVNQMARNYAIARLAPKGVVSHIDGPGMIKMPDDAIQVSVGGEKLSIPKWGELAGKYVNEDLYYSLVSDDVFAREASGAWGKLNSAFKFAKVPLAPYASVRNALTNLLVFAPLVGMEMWNPKNARAYALAFKDLMSAKHNRSDVWKSLLKKGTFNADYMHGEMGVQSAADLGGLWNAVLTTLNKTTDMFHARDVATMGRMARAWLANAKKTVGSAYSFGDDVFRLAYGHKLHEQGVHATRAGKEAADGFTNYSEVPGFVRFLSHPGAAGMLNNSSARLGAGLLYFATGLPFLTFPVAAGKLGLAKMRENPMALARIGALAHAANLSMLGDAGLSEDDWDQIRKALPAAMRDASLRRVEVDPKTGERKYVTVNTGFLNPLQDLFKPDRGLTEESVGDKVQSLFGKGPWMRMIQGAMTGRDDATGRNITTSMDGAGKVADYLSFVGEMWAPPWMPAIESLGFKGGTQVQSRERVDVPNAAGQYKTADDQRSARWGVSQSSMTEPQMMRRIGQMTGSQLGSLSKSAFEYVQSDKFGSGAEQMINSPTRLLAVAIKTQHPGAIKRIQAYEDALRDKVPPVLQAAAEAIRSSRQPRYAQLAKALEDMQAKLLDPQARLGTTTMVVDRVLDKLRELQGQGKLGEVVLPALGGVQ